MMGTSWELPFSELKRTQEYPASVGNTTPSRVGPEAAVQMAMSDDLITDHRRAQGEIDPTVSRSRGVEPLTGALSL